MPIYRSRRDSKLRIITEITMVEKWEKLVKKGAIPANKMHDEVPLD